MTSLDPDEIESEHGKSPMKKLFALMVALLLSASPVSAGKIEKVFSDEIFSVKWESTIEQVAAVFPDGKRNKNQFGFQTYEVRDGRTLLGIKRNPDNYIRFYFNAEGKMDSVTIEFPNGVDGFKIILHKLITYFGPNTVDPNRESMVIEWPEDNGITISLMGVFFNIQYMKADSSVTKEELGF